MEGEGDFLFCFFIFFRLAKKKRKNIMKRNARKKKKTGNNKVKRNARQRDERRHRPTKVVEFAKLISVAYLPEMMPKVGKTKRGKGSKQSWKMTQEWPVTITQKGFPGVKASNQVCGEDRQRERDHKKKQRLLGKIRRYVY